MGSRISFARTTSINRPTLVFRFMRVDLGLGCHDSSRRKELEGKHDMHLKQISACPRSRTEGSGSNAREMRGCQLGRNAHAFGKRRQCPNGSHLRMEVAARQSVQFGQVSALLASDILSFSLKSQYPYPARLRVISTRGRPRREAGDGMVEKTRDGGR